MQRTLQFCNLRIEITFKSLNQLNIDFPVEIQYVLFVESFYIQYVLTQYHTKKKTSTVFKAVEFLS